MYALAIAGCGEEAIAPADGLVDAAEITGNPFALSNALTAEGLAFRDTDPIRALGALRRAIAIAQDTGNRFIESHSANVLSATRRPNTVTRCPRSITSRWPSAIITTRATRE